MAQGDCSTLSWAHKMHHGRQVIVRTSSKVAAGLVNEISPKHVRIGETRIERRDIVTIRTLARSHRTG